MPPEQNSRAGQILVVDDNRMNRLKLTRALEQKGHIVVQAAGGEEALEMLRHPQQQRPFDVVLLDLIMPGMDGFAVLQTIKADATLHDLVVIIVSAIDEMDSIVRCIEMGAEDYLIKPFEPVLLYALLKTSLEKKQLRDLERAYLQQEMTLRQSERLATLGKLSAGVAHELNNPSAAAQSSAAQLLTAIGSLQQAQLHLDLHGLSGTQEAMLLSLLDHAAQKSAASSAIDSLTRSDLEYEVEEWLEAQDIENGWEYAPELVALGYDCTGLRRLGATFSKGQLAAVIAWMSATSTLYALAREISEATTRISTIIKALKSYTYMDQAPIQQVDLHEGLEGTLTILRSKLNEGVVIKRDFAENLPTIMAYGSELNQVWTNLIDNAISAMNDKGHLTLRTHQENGWVIVEIEDDGPGISEADQAKIFDPFFTTKSPGEGTGLGLNISYNIVVQKHHGQITVLSQPGQTCFTVKLPIQATDV